MVATRGRTFKRPWRGSCHSSKLKSSSAPIGRKDSWCFHGVGSSNAPLLGSTAAEGLQRIGRTSIATRWRFCGLPQSASCSENFVIPPDVFGQTLSRERRVDYQDAVSRMRACDRRDIAQDIEIELIVERDVPTISRSKLQEGVATRGRSHDCLGSNIAAHTRPVFDDELLTKVLRQPLTEKTCKQVRHTPRRKSNDQADRPCRIDLRPNEAR